MKPWPTGSRVAAMMTGVDDVACLSAASAGPGARITSTWRRTNFGGQAGKALRFAPAPAYLDHEIASIHVAELVQPLQKGPDGGAPDVCSCPETEDAEPIDLARWLGSSYSGHRRERSEAAKERTPVHQWISASPIRRMRTSFGRVGGSLAEGQTKSPLS